MIKYNYEWTLSPSLEFLMNYRIVIEILKNVHVPRDMGGTKVKTGERS